MLIFWLGLMLFLSTPLGIATWLLILYFQLCRRYLHVIVRIFQEKPLFIIPHGKPVEGAEDVHFPTSDGLTLRGCYLKTTQPRKSVILFGVEFGSNRWSCVPYCLHLVNAGYDVFAYEPRNQGDSDAIPGYEPLQWVTDYEVADAQAAIRYLKSRPDADPRGIGFFGISKGAGAGLQAAARDTWIRCFVTDGMFATYTVLVPYMRHWFRIYNSQYSMQGLLPSWYYGWVGLTGLRQIQRERHCRFPHLEPAMPRLAPRPLLMIHGEGDNYIKPEMARELFALAREPKRLWMVAKAKHNQAQQLITSEYERQVLEFFDKHLAPLALTSPARDPAVPVNGMAADSPPPTPPS